MHKAPAHHSRVLSSPHRGVYSTHIDSARHFGRHWHDTYGFGFLEQGAHGSASGRGYVRAYAGDVITTNPGEIHDGRPLGRPTRRWRILSVDADVMFSMMARRNTHVEITRPVIRDPELVQTLRRLFRRLERWNAGRGANTDNALAFEESLVETCVLLGARHGTVPLPTKAADEDVRRVRDRLADDAHDSPTLADLAAMTGLSRYQVLRRFEKAYGLPPHAWLLRRRAERARLLIRDGSTLAAAAAAAGFSDQSHMTRVFVRQFGFTPGVWRKAVARPPQ
jgi:AraC-like DNA-binding protein